jgi:plastocyanin
VRRAVPFVILAGCLGVGVLPALAADQDVAISDYAFTPKQVAVLPGETVSWHNVPGSVPHNVKFEDQDTALGAASANFSASRTFGQAGTYRYRCALHSSMTGTVYVNATGTVPTPAGSSTPTPSPSPTPTPSPTDGGAGGGSPTGTPPPATGGGGAPVPAVSAFRARAARSRFCTRRTAACRKPGVFLLIDLAAPHAVRVRGTLRRATRRVRAVSMLVTPGHRRVRLPGARLKRGRYSLVLRAGDITRRVHFRVNAA